MKYESELIKEIADSRGHEKSSLHYESECIESWIEETKGAYPKLCDYQSEWLNFIKELNGGGSGGGEEPKPEPPGGGGEEPEPEEPPIGVFPYETVTSNHTATVNHVVPLEYKSAILKGQTDENLQSVQMPVLTTTGKNLFDKSKVKYNTTLKPTGEEAHNRYMSSDFINVEPNKNYVSNHMGVIFYYDENKNFITFLDSPALPQKFTTPNNCKYVRIKCWVQYDTIEKQREIVEMEQLEKGTDATPYEPYKSNILTVNEDNELKSFGDLRDELNLLTGEMTQRVEKIVLDGSEEGWIYDGTRGSTTAIGYIGDYFATPPTNAITNYFSLIVNKDKGFWNSGKDYEMFCVNDKSLAFRIEKTKLKSQDSNGIKEWLSQNNLIIQYDLASPIVKTVDLTVINQDEQPLSKIKPIEGTMHVTVSGTPINPTAVLEVPVEAITQNLNSFIGEE